MEWSLAWKSNRWFMMSTKKILVIDDDDLIRALVIQFLRDGGYEAVMAVDGADGIARYESERPDLVVLDIAMPGLSGFETADAIRRIQGEHGWSHTPIVLLTAYARSFVGPVGHDQRIDSFIPKPVDREAFLQHIRRFLG